jgi:hypothetical protein
MSEGGGGGKRENVLTGEAGRGNKNGSCVTSRAQNSK